MSHTPGWGLHPKSSWTTNWTETGKRKRKKGRGREGREQRKKRRGRKINLKVRWEGMGG